MTDISAIGPKELTLYPLMATIVAIWPSLIPRPSGELRGRPLNSPDGLGTRLPLGQIEFFAELANLTLAHSLH